MKAKFNYTYFGVAIQKNEFEKNVPENWQNDLDKYFNYSFGGYRSTLVVDEIVVDKSDFEIEEHLGGYYSIKGHLFGKEIKVLGGDSANKDDYNREYFEEVYDKWDGKLFVEQDYLTIDI